MHTIAQLTYIPLATHNPTELVQDLLEHLAQYEVKIEVGYLSSTVIGEPDEVFKLIKETYEMMSVEQERFRFHIELLSPEM
ncbi:MAG: hypothetical protein CL672_01385 [Balneola sp.]|nr:hypothetical protein [Balneola sp.]|tara:strand:+ start:4423 stop:4665 length:243 start_codon:yes stop_codon:yes gene_type:complete